MIHGKSCRRWAPVLAVIAVLPAGALAQYSNSRAQHWEAWAGARLIQSAFAPDRARVTLEYCPGGLRCRISIEMPPTTVAQGTDSIVEACLPPRAPAWKQLT